jgi:SAM-dependent methyltransferase
VNDEREKLIGELVKRSYEDPYVVSRYTSVGLWPAEEIIVVEFFPDEAFVLDLGCGAGRTSIALAELGMQVVGIDISETMIQVAQDQASRAQVEVDHQVMDSRRLDFADNSFNIVLYSYNGLELVPGMAGKRAVLQEVYRVLKPGGRFIFTTHSLFACNRFAVFRLLSFLRFCAGRFLGLPVREQELGERFSDHPEEEVKYLQVLPPFLWLRALRQCGFEIRYFNTHRRLEKGKKWGFPGHFEDGERFYVAQKS